MTAAAALPQPAHVRKLGEGARPALALHCTIAHSGAWRGLAGILGQEATFIAPDMLSHGRSPDWDRQGDFQDRITEIALAQLTGPMDLIGHSFGATVALRLAVEHPELVRSAVLIEPVFFAVAVQDAPDLMAQHNRDVQPYLDAMAAGDEALAARRFNRLWSTDDSPRWPELPESTRAAMTRGIHVVPTVDSAVTADRAGLLKPGVLDRATMPVLLMRGALTHPVIGAVNTGLEQRLPNASNAVIDGAGHMLPISHPSETAARISSFWRAR